MSDISCMSFNVLSWDTENGGFDPPESRLGYVLKTIEKYDPDLLGVQEACELHSHAAAEFEWYHTLIAAMDKRGWAAAGIKEQPGYEMKSVTIAHGLIIFYKKERFTLQESGCMPYPIDRKVRYFQWVKLTDNRFHRNIVMTNTHLSITQRVCGVASSPATAAVRATEAAILADFWYKNCDEHTALFATGDYNSLPASAAHEVLQTGVFRPSSLVAEAWDDIGSTYKSRQYHTIDFCYVNPTATKIDEYRVDTTRFAALSDSPNTGLASDHRAIITRATYR